MKKIIKTITASALTASIAALSVSFLPSSVKAGAATDDVIFHLAAEKTYITQEELSKGDVTVPLKFYIEPKNMEQTFETAQFKFTADYNNIYFKNMTDYSQRNDASKSYTLSVGTFETYYTPFCFGSVSESRSNKLVYKMNGSITTNSSSKDHNTNGFELKSDGNNGVYFTYENYKSSANDSGHDKIFATDPTIFGLSDNDDGKISYTKNENGTTTYVYSLSNQKNNYAAEGFSFTINCLPQGLKKNTPIPGNSDRLTWLSTTSVKILGEKNELDFVELDAVVKKGTPSGKYTISVDPEFSSLMSSSRVKYAAENSNTTINNAVIEVVDSVEFENIDMKKTYFYNDEKAQKINVSDFVTSASAKITKNGQAQIVDITDQITTNKDYYTSDIYKNGFNLTSIEMPLYYNCNPLKDKSGNNIIGTAIIGKKGDVNLDGSVDAKDATKILVYYAKDILNPGSASIADDSSNEDIVYFLSDIDDESRDHGKTGGKVDSKDATYILTYYAKRLLNSNTAWNDVLK